jgi:hypothetical protein
MKCLSNEKTTDHHAPPRFRISRASANSTLRSCALSASRFSANVSRFNASPTRAAFSYLLKNKLFPNEGKMKILSFLARNFQRNQRVERILSFLG